MVLNEPFTTATQTLVSYNYTDILANGGFLELYGAKIYDTGDSALDFVLTSDKTFGSVHSYTSAGAGAGVQMNNVEFDGVVNTDIRVTGSAFISIPVYIINSNATEFTTTVTLYHINSGGTDTIGTGTYTTNATASGSMLDRDQIMSFRITGVNFHIAKGDTIRLKVHAATTGSGSPTGYVFHDPLNRTGVGNTNSVMKVLLPVPVD